MYERALVKTLTDRMNENDALVQILYGPRQTGKSTALTQAAGKATRPVHFVSADFGDERWLRSEWQQARNLASGSAILIVDEIQKVEGWANIVKDLWDEDRRAGTPLGVFLSGSSSLLLSSGANESLMGRFEMIHSPQWTLSECRDAFGFGLDDFLFFGGYPRAASYKDDFRRWRTYMLQSVIEPTIAQDVLAMRPVRNPTLMRSLFELGATYSGQELSLNKMLGQLQGRGNTATLAEYLGLLSTAGMLSGLPKYDPKMLKRKRSSPRLLAHDASLCTAMLGYPPEHLREDRATYGHVVETAVGCYLLNRGRTEQFEVTWWREGQREVDFVIRSGRSVTAIEVKSGAVKGLAGMAEFLELYPQAKRLVVGSPECPLKAFLLGEIDLW